MTTRWQYFFSYSGMTSLIWFSLLLPKYLTWSALEIMRETGPTPGRTIGLHEYSFGYLLFLAYMHYQIFNHRSFVVHSMVLTTHMESVGYPMRRGSQCPDPPWMKHGKIIICWAPVTHWQLDIIQVDDCVSCDLQLSWCEGHMTHVITVMSPESYNVTKRAAWVRACNSNRSL